MEYLLITEYDDCSTSINRFETLEEAKNELNSRQGDESIEYLEIVEYQPVIAWSNPESSSEKDYF